MNDTDDIPEDHIQAKDMNGSYHLGSPFGIGIFVHWTFGLLLGWIALVSLSHGAGFVEILGAFVLIAAIFGCVTLHELGHSLAARQFGIRTRHITLFPIGGVAMLESMPRNPRHELLIAVAGPAVNVAIIGLLLILSFLAGVAGLGSSPAVFDLSFGGGLIGNLILINAILVLFNMIPAFPMDGGRVLRALMSMRMGHWRATNVAAGIGKIFALVLAGFGLFYNPILIITALFVYFGAEAERRAAFVGAIAENDPNLRPGSPPAAPRPDVPRTGPDSDPVWEIVRDVPPKARRLHAVRWP